MEAIKGLGRAQAGSGGWLMPLTGQAKTDYQREYMRKYRSNAKPVSVRPLTIGTVRPKPILVRPKGLSDNQWAYIQSKDER